MREYLLVLFVAMATTFLLTGVARQIALRYGAVAKVRARDVHKVPIPYFGGLSILGGLIAAYAVASNLPFLGNSLQVAHDARAIL
ncbi:MAG TPA: undecaprenyl/decaprenyl-phosphate alpha-N-acetylglucosaminyl 1-phosphate transferase, partial [Kribbella sp.]